MRNSQVQAGDVGQPRARVLLLAMGAATYVIASLLTTWIFIGDAPDYARSALSQFHKGDCFFLEFGHLLWRPTGYALLSIGGGAAIGESKGAWLHAISVMNGAAWVAGLIAVLCIADWLYGVTASVSAAMLGVVFFVVNKSFLSFSQVGTSYVPALACLAVALWCGTADSDSRAGRATRAIVAGVFLGGSMLYWATFLFAAPAVLLAPLVLSKDWRARLPGVVLTALTCAALMIGVYAWAGSALGLHTLSDYRAWVSDSQHGIAVGGVARAAVGLARFIVDLGTYGALVKRYMVHDPYNAVSIRQLVNLDLAKFFVIYAFGLLCTMLAWRAPEGRRTVILFLATMTPVLGFGVLWQGGDLERYLPALPALSLLVAQAYLGAAQYRTPRAMVVGIVGGIALINIVALFGPTVRATRQATMDRLAGVTPDAIKSDLFVVSHWQDPLMAAVRDDPFESRVRAGLTLYPLVTFGTPQVTEWRQQFASRILTSWKNKRRTWVSTRLLAERPELEWAWVEGDDPRIQWKDLRQFFSSLEYQGAGGAGEFRVLSDTPQNRAFLESIARPERGGEAAGAAACKNTKIFNMSVRA